jgi:methylated-DNA-[protein]-cysteine S-methyltransferase
MSAKRPEFFDFGRLQTPIGIALLVTDADGALRALDWENYEARLRQLLRLHYGVVVLRDAPASDDLKTALEEYFAGDLDSLKTINWRVAGTPFQRKVWTALTTIPAGTTTSYGKLAAQLGMPQAVRAVGHANGSNPVSVVVPCHRVIGANGSLTGYGGGLSRKRWLLEHEGVVLKASATRCAMVASVIANEAKQSGFGAAK